MSIEPPVALRYIYRTAYGSHWPSNVISLNTPPQFLTYFNIIRMARQLPSADHLRRTDRLKFRLMPDGHIRAFQEGTPDKRGISEFYVYPPHCRAAPTIVSARPPLLLIADTEILNLLANASRRLQHTLPDRETPE